MATNPTPPRNDRSRAASGAKPGASCDNPAKAEENLGYYADSAEQQARDAKEQTTASTRDMSHEAKERVQAASEEARRRITETAGQLKDQGRSAISRRKEKAAAELGHISAAVRQAADKLHQEKDETLASYAESMASCVDDVGHYIRDRDISGLADDAGSLVRKRPEVALGGLFIAGLAMARFLKASDRPQPRTRTVGGPPVGDVAPPPPAARPTPQVNVPPTPPVSPAVNRPVSQGAPNKPIGGTTNRPL